MVETPRQPRGWEGLGPSPGFAGRTDFFQKQRSIQERRRGIRLLAAQSQGLLREQTCRVDKEGGKVSGCLGGQDFRSYATTPKRGVACLGGQGFRFCATTPRLPEYANRSSKVWVMGLGVKAIPPREEVKTPPQVGVAWGLPRTYNSHCLGEIKNSTPRS
ncbi:hypothetical protein L873DRAFT_1840878 [Choiromyces venosus 120613-1]|uniref:Uncharacterized protein n=1 Tax=Choiromyces venosus 120613-1 TaxID=1336337 RepID=A0A3N4JZ27_9PEZI|nr:hypothetical protein L873DRAFT_1840878 [Choiromyces venosus 120613-1]